MRCGLILLVLNSYIEFFIKIMNAREHYINNITDILSILRTKVELRNSINLYDVNIHAENFYRDLFNLIYDWGLEDLNAQTTNASYIDLVDIKNKKAIQVTSQNDSGKIRKSVNGFLKKSENKGFELKVLLIARLAKAYTTDFTFEDYKFEPDKDVIDIERLIKSIKDKDTDRLGQISDFLSKEAALPRLKTETTEVETIMSLIEFLSKEENLNDEEEKPSEVDPDRKIFHRFEEHSDFLTSQYEDMYALYFGTLKIAKEKVGLDGIRARTIAIYLKNKSDSILNECNNNPRNAINKLTDFLEGKLTSNGFICSNSAIHFYLLDELIECNVFPNPIR